MYEAMTPADFGMILAGLVMALAGGLGLAGLLTLELLLFIVAGTGALYVSFIAGIEYGNPRRA